MAQNNQEDYPVKRLAGFWWTVLGVSVFGLIAVVIYQLGLEEETSYSAGFQEGKKNLAKVVATQQSNIADWSWVDEEKGLVKVPIGQAMDLAGSYYLALEPAPLSGLDHAVPGTPTHDKLLQELTAPAAEPASESEGTVPEEETEEDPEASKLDDSPESAG
ncbi:MAG: hypothetical protein AAF555_05380 [Verrucomicrobiota bacterium]